MLEEVRLMAKNKQNLVHRDPEEKKENIEFADSLIAFFDNTDAIAGAPRSLVLGSLLFIGYEFDKLDDIYQKLIDEINKVYTCVSPEMIEEAKKNHK